MSTLNFYKRLIDGSIESVIKEEVGEGYLSESCKYALEGGKRIRGSIILAIADSKKKGFCQRMILPAIAIECLHSSSLVIDDLPCMDNDDMRRGKMSVHKKFGENVAQLTSATLTTVTFQLMTKHIDAIAQAKGLFGTTKDSADSVSAIIYLKKMFDLLKRIHNAIGEKGLCGGEIQEILSRRNNEQCSDEKLRDVIRKKTSSLFLVSFLSGYVFMYPELDKFTEVEDLANEFGFLFQVQDDIQDFDEDKKAERKYNYAILHGKNKSLKDLKESIYRFVSKAQALEIWSPFFAEIIAKIIKKVNDNVPNNILILKGTSKK
jgi:geranylgeranyl diphosphate synthase type II